MRSAGEQIDPRLSVLAQDLGAMGPGKRRGEVDSLLEGVARAGPASYRGWVLAGTRTSVHARLRYDPQRDVKH